MVVRVGDRRRRVSHLRSARGAKSKLLFVFVFIYCLRVCFCAPSSPLHATTVQIGKNTRCSTTRYYALYAPTSVTRTILLSLSVCTGWSNKHVYWFICTISEVFFYGTNFFLLKLQLPFYSCDSIFHWSIS